MLLWKSGKQTVVSASTAESELVEILEGALAGDAVRVVLEGALSITARAVSFTDNMASSAIVTGDSGSWRTRHLKKRAHILKTKVIQGDWLLRHMPANELPADLGAKVLSSDKFKGHKRLMGMFVGKDDENQEVGKRENGDERKNMVSQYVAKKALKAIILFAQIAKARSQDDDSVQLWHFPRPIRSFQ
jgi:hypothetical protein